MTAAIALLLALAAAQAAGQSEVAASIAVHPAQVVVGGEVQARITVRGAEAGSTRIVPPVFDGLTPAGEPEVREGSSGLLVTYRLRAERRGEQTLGSFLVRTPRAAVATEPVRITVVRRAASAAAAEARLRWRLETTTPFAWQAVEAVLELTATAPLPLVGRPELEEVVALDVTPLPVRRGIEPAADPGRYVIPVARYRLIARTAGRLTLPPARALVAGVEHVSDSIGLVIRPLPEPIADSRAVGDIERRVALRRIGTEAFELTVEVFGSGSVPFVEHPPPAVRAGSVVDMVVDVVVDVTAEADAAVPRKRWRYRLRGEGSDALSVVVPALPYLRLPDGEQAQIEAEAVDARPPAFAAPEAALPLIDPAEHGCGTAPVLTDRRAACRAARLHGLGVSRYAEGDVGVAVLALRAGLRLRGWPETRAALAAIEEAHGLDGLAHGSDTAPWRRLAWAVGCVLAAGSAVAALRRGSSRRARALTVTAGAAAAALVVAAAALAAPAGEVERRVAVIGPAGAAVLRIPAPEGTVAGRLPAGSTVAVRHRFDDYALIEAGSVGSGWVATGALADLAVSARGR